MPRFGESKQQEPFSKGKGKGGQNRGSREIPKNPEKEAKKILSNGIFTLNTLTNRAKRTLREVAILQEEQYTEEKAEQIKLKLEKAEKELLEVLAAEKELDEKIATETGIPPDHAVRNTLLKKRDTLEKMRQATTKEISEAHAKSRRQEIKKSLKPAVDFKIDDETKQKIPTIPQNPTMEDLLAKGRIATAGEINDFADAQDHLRQQEEARELEEDARLFGMRLAEPDRPLHEKKPKQRQNEGIMSDEEIARRVAEATEREQEEAEKIAEQVRLTQVSHASETPQSILGQINRSPEKFAGSTRPVRVAESTNPYNGENVDPDAANDAAFARNRGMFERHADKMRMAEVAPTAPELIREADAEEDSPFARSAREELGLPSKFDAAKRSLTPSGERSARIPYTEDAPYNTVPNYLSPDEQVVRNIHTAQIEKLFGSDTRVVIFKESGGKMIPDARIVAYDKVAGTVKVSFREKNKSNGEYATVTMEDLLAWQPPSENQKSEEGARVDRETAIKENRYTKWANKIQEIGHRLDSKKINSLEQLYAAVTYDIPADELPDRSAFEAACMEKEPATAYSVVNNFMAKFIGNKKLSNEQSTKRFSTKKAWDFLDSIHTSMTKEVHADIARMKEYAEAQVDIATHKLTVDPKKRASGVGSNGIVRY